MRGEHLYQKKIVQNSFGSALDWLDIQPTLGLLIRPSRRLFKPKRRPDQIHYFNTAQAQSLTETCTCWIYALGSL